MQSFLHKANIETVTNEYKHECDTIYIGLHVLVYKQIIHFRRMVISLFPVKKTIFLAKIETAFLILIIFYFTETKGLKDKFPKFMYSKILP